MPQPPNDFFSTNTNDTTQAILIYLNYHGFKAWRNNTMGVFDPEKGIYRRNPGLLKGVPDIIGFRLSDGVFIGVEVKTGQDHLSQHQQAFLEELRRAGGLPFVATSFDDFITNFKKKLTETAQTTSIKQT